MKIFQTFCRATWREGNRSWSLGFSTAPVWGNNKVETLCSDWFKSWCCWCKLSYAINPLRKARNARCPYIGGFWKRSIVGAGVRNIMIRPIMDSICGCAPIIFSVFNYNINIMNIILDVPTQQKAEPTLVEFSVLTARLASSCPQILSSLSLCGG